MLLNYTRTGKAFWNRRFILRLHVLFIADFGLSQVFNMVKIFPCFLLCPPNELLQIPLRNPEGRIDYYIGAQVDVRQAA